MTEKKASNILKTGSSGNDVHRCYVCGGMAHNPLYIGMNLYRHRSKCAPGSKAWMESVIGLKSPYWVFFAKAQGV